MDQQLNSSADLFSTRSAGDNQSLLKPASNLAGYAPFTAEAREADWKQIYTPNEPDAAEEAPQPHNRRSRLVERDKRPTEPETAVQPSAPEPIPAPATQWQPEAEAPAPAQPLYEQPPSDDSYDAEPYGEEPSYAEPSAPAYDAPEAPASAYSMPEPPARPNAVPYPPQCMPAYAAQNAPEGQTPPVYWMPAMPAPEGQGGQAPVGWPPYGTQPVYIPVYFAPYPPSSGAPEASAAYPFPPQVPAYDAPGYDAPAQAEPSAAPARPSWRDEPKKAPREDKDGYEENHANDADALPADDDDDWQPAAGEGADAVPSEQMAAPVPVAMSKLDFAAGKKRHTWLWVVLIVLFVLLAAAFTLWKTGLYQKLPIPGLSAFLSSRLEAQPTATAQPVVEAKPVVTTFSGEGVQGIAPAEVTFTVVSNVHVKQIRLMNTVGIPLSAQIRSEIAEDVQTWSCQVSFPSSYQGDVFLFVCGEDGVWADSGYKVTLGIE